MLFNEKIDHLIKLGFKTNPNFKKELKKMVNAIPVLSRHKLLKTKYYEYSFINCGLSFYVNNQKDNIATDIELELDKTKLFNQDDETNFAFSVELPYQKDIDEMDTDSIDDVEKRTNGMLIWELMAFEYCNEDSNKQFEFDFVKTKDGYYLVCEESIGYGLYGGMFDDHNAKILGFTRYKLTDEDLKILTIEGEKQYENEISV